MNIYDMTAMLERNDNDELTDGAKLKILEREIEERDEKDGELKIMIENIIKASTTDPITIYALRAAYKQFDEASYNAFMLTHSQEIFKNMRK